MKAKRYIVATSHMAQRTGQRGIGLDDVLNAVEKASACDPYPAMQEHGGTCWRVAGPALDETPKKKATVISVGIEAFEDERGEMVVLVTVFNAKKKGGVL